MSYSPGSLFVGDLSVCFQEGHLRELFHPFGNIIKTELRQGFKAHKLLGHGFITFSTFQEAENAMKNMNGVLVLGRRLRITWASNNSSFHKDTVCAEVVFSFVSKQLNYMVYEQTIRDLFSGYDTDVLDISMKQFKVEEQFNKQSGIGFVHFPLTPQGILSAKRAVDQLTNVAIRDVMYDSELSMNLQTIIEDNPHLNLPFIPVNPLFCKGGNKANRGVAKQITIGFELPYMHRSAFAHLIRHSNIMASNNSGYGNNGNGKFNRQQLIGAQMRHDYPVPIPEPIMLHPIYNTPVLGSNGYPQHFVVPQTKLSPRQQQQQQPVVHNFPPPSQEENWNEVSYSGAGNYPAADYDYSDYPHERKRAAALRRSNDDAAFYQEPLFGVHSGDMQQHVVSSDHFNSEIAATDSDTDNETHTPSLSLPVGSEVELSLSVETLSVEEGVSVTSAETNKSTLHHAVIPPPTTGPIRSVSMPLSVPSQSQASPALRSRPPQGIVRYNTHSGVASSQHHGQQEEVRNQMFYGDDMTLQGHHHQQQQVYLSHKVAKSASSHGHPQSHQQQRYAANPQLQQSQPYLDGQFEYGHAPRQSNSPQSMSGKHTPRVPVMSLQQKQIALQRERELLLKRQQQLESELADIQNYDEENYNFADENRNYFSGSDVQNETSGNVHQNHNPAAQRERGSHLTAPPATASTTTLRPSAAQFVPQSIHMSQQRQTAAGHDRFQHRQQQSVRQMYADDRGDAYRFGHINGTYASQQHGELSDERYNPAVLYSEEDCEQLDGGNMQMYAEAPLQYDQQYDQYGSQSYSNDGNNLQKRSPVTAATRPHGMLSSILSDVDYSFNSGDGVSLDYQGYDGSVPSSGAAVDVDDNLFH